MPSGRIQIPKSPDYPPPTPGDMDNSLYKFEEAVRQTTKVY